jgi:tRNA-2-methylthio-N6-dimethylallyladenosine synthase
MPNYYIWTIGCQMNKAESERLGSLFNSRGYLPVDEVQKADLILLNGCVVRRSAEDKILNKIHSLKSLKNERPKLEIAVTGCLVGEEEIEGLKRTFPFVDYFFGAGESPYWLGQEARPRLPKGTTPSALVPIIQGCNNFCTYCIVPYRRGRETSRPTEEIVREVRELVDKGAREVVLLGQNVDSYGHDLTPPCELADLLEKLNGIEDLYRIRFLTNHPKDLSPRLIDTIAGLDKVCEQLSLPVQAGDDAVLKTMGRGYTAAHYKKLVATIREKVPAIAISTDVIVGFPGESEQQFQASYELLKELRFDKVHCAVYSPRKGTVAAEYKDDVAPTEKKRRLYMVEELEKKIATEINAALRGKKMEVLIEGKKKGKWQGRSRSDKLVFVASETNLQGKLITVEITETSPWSLKGQVLDK